MNQEQWSEVDAYFSERLIPADPILERTLIACDVAGLPQQAVTATQGKFLQLIAQIQRASRILEFGTLGGYSTIWLARAVPKGGSVTTLEANAQHAAIAKSNIEEAGFSDVVDIRVGKAIDTLPLLQNEAPFDLIFIDADKQSNPTYLEWALKLSRPGTVIIGDNIVRNGAVIDPTSVDANVIGVRKFFDLMSENPRLSATAIQTVGSKGYDGFSLAVVQ
jgi:predicted O-methyltransferase YrrM